MPVAFLISMDLKASNSFVLLLRDPHNPVRLDRLALGSPVTSAGAIIAPGYRKDHVLPLACGGPDAVSNMQWQTVAAAKAKDRWEVRACGR